MRVEPSLSLKQYEFNDVLEWVTDYEMQATTYAMVLNLQPVGLWAEITLV